MLPKYVIPRILSVLSDILNSFRYPVPESSSWFNSFGSLDHPDVCVHKSIDSLFSISSELRAKLIEILIKKLICWFKKAIPMPIQTTCTLNRRINFPLKETKIRYLSTFRYLNILQIKCEIQYIWVHIGNTPSLWDTIAKNISFILWQMWKVA